MKLPGAALIPGVGRRRAARARPVSAIPASSDEATAAKNAPPKGVKKLDADARSNLNAD